MKEDSQEESISQHFTSPPDLRLFHVRVWEVARCIPPGKVATYGQIAALLPPPGGMDPKVYLAFGARWVGGAMAACPEDVPWQRVINAQGRISPRPGALDQRVLLEEEGIRFDEGVRIDLKKYRWEPEESWCREHGMVPTVRKTEQKTLL